MSAQNSPTIIDPASTPKWTWEGWGVSLCWWGKIYGNRDDIADLVFTLDSTTLGEQKLPGLGLNIVRYNAGASSWNVVDGKKMAISNTILPFRQIEGYWLDGKNPDPESASWDWKLDAAQRNMMLKAKSRGANRFELFSNAPMWWMCENLNPSGRKGKTEENLSASNYKLFATYLATIALRAREKWGINFETVDPFNEPISGYWTENCKQEGCYFSPQSQVAFLPILRAVLDEHGLADVGLSTSDETSYTQALKVWGSYPPAAKSLVTRVNVHGYEGTKGPRKALGEAIRRDNKNLWNSEYGDKHADGMQMARCLGQDIQELRATAWCYWQALDGGNSSGWGLIGADLTKGEIYSANTKYFVLAQFSRHIRPGATILLTGSSDMICAYDEKRKVLTLVAIGKNIPVEKSVNFSRFSLPDARARCWVTETKGIARYDKRADVALETGVLNFTLAPDAVQTYEIQNVTLPSL